MGAVARAARAGGAPTVGVIPRALVDIEIADDDAELVVTEDMRSRKGEMDRRSDAFLVLPGGLAGSLGRRWIFPVNVPVAGLASSSPCCDRPRPGCLGGSPPSTPRSASSSPCCGLPPDDPARRRRGGSLGLVGVVLLAGGLTTPPLLLTRPRGHPPYALPGAAVASTAALMWRESCTASATGWRRAAVSGPA